MLLLLQLILLPQVQQLIQQEIGGILILFHNPRTTPFVRKVESPEERKRNNAINSGLYVGLDAGKHAAGAQTAGPLVTACPGGNEHNVSDKRT